MHEKWKEVLALVPKPPQWKVAWTDIENSLLQGYADKMKITLQNPVWHGEGDAWSHTKMVCEELVKLQEFRLLDEERQQLVFIAAILHDIGKIPCTRLENDEWVSPNHTAVGARMARELLWKRYDFCGTKKLQQFRETVCTLIRYHSVPPHILEQQNPELRLVKIASNGELLPNFSIELLCLLEEADVKGRVSASLEQSIELIELCREQADELGCLKTSVKFPTAYSEFAYLEGRNIALGQELYDDTWGEVILMSGLPATGKDTWIREHYSEYPMISLDDIRETLNVTPTKNQGIVINSAREKAKEYLRKKQSFVWNATNLTPMLREKQISLFKSYNASVRIVFLETDWREQLRRNSERKAEVPENVISQMLGSLVLPERFEAHYVEWDCV